jgi:hypothetical protein
VLDTVTGATESTPGYTIAVYAAPNPFNPATTITYSIPEDGPVWVSVYSVGGRVVDELVAGEQREAGIYRLRYRPELASGVYFVRVRTPAGSRTASLVLLK